MYETTLTSLQPREILLKMVFTDLIFIYHEFHNLYYLTFYVNKNPEPQNLPSSDDSSYETKSTKLTPLIQCSITLLLSVSEYQLSEPIRLSQGTVNSPKTVL